MIGSRLRSLDEAIVNHLSAIQVESIGEVFDSAIFRGISYL